MKALLVFDYSQSSGLGHLRRALAIAGALKVLGWSTTFGNTATRACPIGAGLGTGDAEVLLGLGGKATKAGRLRTQFDACVVDSYMAGPDLRESLAPYVAIDDYYLPIPGAEAVVNPAPGADQDRYELEMKLIGPKYALLAGDVIEARNSVVEPAFPPRKVYLWLGAGGTPALLETITEELKQVLPDAKIVLPPDEISLGGGANLIAQADMVVCAGGVTALEAAALGRPSIGLMLAENQRANILGLQAAGALIQAKIPGISDAVAELTKSRDEFVEFSRRGRTLVDGHGAARVANAITRDVSKPTGGKARLD